MCICRYCSHRIPFSIPEPERRICFNCFMRKYYGGELVDETLIHLVKRLHNEFTEEPVEQKKLGNAKDVGEK